MMRDTDGERERDERKRDFSFITVFTKSPSAMTLVQWKVLFQGSKVMQHKVVLTQNVKVFGCKLS